MDTWMAAKIEARSIGRRIGLTQLLQRLQRRLPGHRGYEAKVKTVLRAAVCEGDTVWDVGANVGLYTQLLSDWVGPQGHVVAFEPVPSCFALLCDKTKGRGNVRVLNVGLSDTQAQLPMHLDDDPEGTTHTFAMRRATGPVVQLAVHPGDALRQVENVPAPNVLKIDVEGFEPEALRGLDATLREPTCRMVLCEVHFGVLEARGQKHAPREIQRYLGDRGFSTKWIDASHLGAYRGS